MSLFVLSSKDGWVDIMYHGLDAVGIDKQVQYFFNLRLLTLHKLNLYNKLHIDLALNRTCAKFCAESVQQTSYLFSS